MRSLALTLLVFAGCDDGGGALELADAAALGDFAPVDSALREAGQLDAEAPPDGVLAEATFLVELSVAELAPLVGPGVQLDNGYALWRLRYDTGGAQARATVAVPAGVDPPETGWGVAVNNPYTVGVADACTLGDWAAGAGLAGLFGARGMVGVAVDYPGLGTPGVHPYLVARVEGRASLDAARATLELAEREGIAVSGRAAFVGTSQGGHASIAAAAEHATYAPDLDAVGFAAAAPSSVFAEQWAEFVDVPGPHLVFHALLTYAWAATYGHDGPSPWAPGLRDTIDEVMETRCLLTAEPQPTLWDALGEGPGAIFSAAFLRAFATLDFGDYPFMARGFADNRLQPYTQTAPLLVYQGRDDRVVLEAHTRALVEVLRAGGVEVDYRAVPGAGHNDLAFGFLAARQLRTEESVEWVRARLER